MGFFTKLAKNLVEGVMDFALRSVLPSKNPTKKLEKAVEDVTDALNDTKVELDKSKYISMLEEIRSYARDADDNYRALIYENLNQVPAVKMYDGPYDDRLWSLESRIESATKEKQLDKIESDIHQLATEIQTFLNEETANIEAAKLWDAKFVKGVREHIPPHALKDELPYDSVMSEVMEAFRRWTEIGQAQIDMYGSQRLINATYEAVEEGEDAMDYMNSIIDLNSRLNSGFGGYHETISVPYAGFFGGGFFF